MRSGIPSSTQPRVEITENAPCLGVVPVVRFRKLMISAYMLVCTVFYCNCSNVPILAMTFRNLIVLVLHEVYETEKKEGKYSTRAIARNKRVFCDSPGNGH